MQYKYPRTLHLPWSEGVTSDDKKLPDVSIFSSKTVVVTEKMDGENTSLYHNHIHARSMDSGNHVSRHWLKALHAKIKRDIPKGWRVCGENLYAKHSIFYDTLPSYFLVFGVYDENNVCLSWDDTKLWCSLLDLECVPELYTGIWNEAVVKNCFKQVSSYGAEQEGYVVRVADAFAYEDFGSNVAKFVRADHVQTDTHWMHGTIIPNGRKC